MINLIKRERERSYGRVSEREHENMDRSVNVTEKLLDHDA